MKTVGALVLWPEVSQSLDKVQVGDLESVMRCRDILTRFGKPITRSMIRRFFQAMANALRSAHWADIRVGFPTFIWWLCFPSDMRALVDNLDGERLAVELGKCRPRERRLVLEFASFSGPSGDVFFSGLLERMNVDTLTASVSAQAEGCEYELRCLIWFLSRATGTRRDELAHALYVEALAACGRSEVEKPRIIEAYQVLHPLLAEKLVAELALQPSDDTPKDPDHELMKLETISQIQKRFAAMDASGEDYLVDEILAPFMGDKPEPA